ncbi:MAG: glycosyltransferase [Bryobacteraceae bacterium]
MTVVEQSPGRGAAAARNSGARRAAADLLLFLDDDMEAAPALLAEHFGAHRQRDNTVVLGYFPMQPPAPEDDPFTKAARIWWADGFAERNHPGYRFTLRDLCTGNVSMSRDTFERVGRYDEQIDHRGAGEDYEIGYRLISSGAKFRFVREAASVHHTLTPLSTSLRRAEQEGYGQAVLVQRHPELFWEFNVSRLSRLAESNLFRPFWRMLWQKPGLASAPMTLLRIWVSFLAGIVCTASYGVFTDHFAAIITGKVRATPWHVSRVGASGPGCSA